MIRRPPRSTLDRSSAASDVYKRQFLYSLASVPAFSTRFILKYKIGVILCLGYRKISAHRKLYYCLTGILSVCEVLSCVRRSACLSKVRNIALYIWCM
eukprot:TRINITY_DN10697_c0_g7_i1.p1 TRINITY_DN10697_c0_g7~~TRINITY_DN10697_c0_g7_i1.p1  ORF type:complete len:105 (+),score=3.72 TRINITY_DN10697_c0_g7_i1:23-316(+)